MIECLIIDESTYGSVTRLHNMIERHFSAYNIKPYYYTSHVNKTNFDLVILICNLDELAETNIITSEKISGIENIGIYNIDFEEFENFVRNRMERIYSGIVYRFILCLILNDGKRMNLENLASGRED